MAIFNPVSTYRLQFNKDFRFLDAEKILKYLHNLGIRTIYASPILQAIPGSNHGYDVINPGALNPEIGSQVEFENLIRKTRKMKIGWLQDIVPNHMAYSPDNSWIYDILEKGRISPYYKYFDIFSDHPDKLLRERIMLPFFGKKVEEMIKDNELRLIFNRKGFHLAYFESEYPVSARTYPFILQIGKAKRIPERIKDFAEVPGHSETWTRNLYILCLEYEENESIKKYINKCISGINNDPLALKNLIDNLDYLPVHWKETEDRINFRRFFTINGLISLNIQEEETFMSVHELILNWINNGKIDGLRIDHIDGLYDPAGYLDRLRKKAGKEIYLSVEKILMKDEKIPENWPVQGTTGYDFLAMANNLLANPDNGPGFYTFYNSWHHHSEEPEEFFYAKKHFILFNRLRGELDYLTHIYLRDLVNESQEVTENEHRRGISEFLLQCPVYKIYNPPSAFTPRDKDLVKSIFSNALKNDPENNKALNLLKKFFLTNRISNQKEYQKIDSFFLRCMQFTGPLTAKGIEDTGFYSYNPFLAFNEVGDSPEYFAISISDFHSHMQERLEKSPLALNTLSTHDTKRGADARARLNVLSELPEKWKKLTEYWAEINQEYRYKIEEKIIPSPNDEYFIYQTLCAHLPMNARIDENFIRRTQDYLLKAFREAKVNTSWSEPDQEYEEKTKEFVSKILSGKNEFRDSYLKFQQTIIPHGIINSLTQLMLKNTVPGIPDTYQGSENWNLSFVDPDNRQEVDYTKLNQDLNKMIRDYRKDPERFIQNLWHNQENGKIKHWTGYISLQERVDHEDLFLKGSYIPLKVKGMYKNNIIAFYRRYRDNHLMVILPLHTAGMPDEQDWKNTRVIIPKFSPVKWINKLSGELFKISGYLEANALFSKLPFGILRGQPNKPERLSGTLLHISSLAGKYGIGDFGPEARNFIDFLKNTGQRYWQTLPLNQSEKLTQYSPYSSYSAFAGNILFIDPHHLSDIGLIKKEHIRKYRMKTRSRVDYKHAEMAKNEFLNIAFENFLKKGKKELRDKFEDFKNKERTWLRDFALFLTIKKQQNNKSWNLWPESFRNRDPESLMEFSEKHKDEFENIFFNQFIFSEQWKSVKSYANDRAVDIFGDIPIYINYDSADVWSNPELFQLNTDKTMKSVAGVPPDYFNENGQLWGMPLFNWKQMQKDGYRWWLNRIQKNLEWFDLLRLDHFRGFSAFWKVPAGSETAINGRWEQGPGDDLFQAIRAKFPSMPFVAEDLGQIDQDVYDLRDRFKLPGMRIVQFGFGDNMPFLQHNPVTYTHNSIVYTGTHDNNTLVGWFRKEADKKTVKRFKKFTGNKLKEKNCHLEIIRLAFSSVAKLAIIPMQDWLGLDESARMNFPSTTSGNWQWKLTEGQLESKLEKEIRKQVKTFGRY